MIGSKMLLRALSRHLLMRYLCMRWRYMVFGREALLIGIGAPCNATRSVKTYAAACACMYRSIYINIMNNCTVYIENSCVITE